MPIQDVPSCQGKSQVPRETSSALCLSEEMVPKGRCVLREALWTGGGGGVGCWTLSVAGSDLRTESRQVTIVIKEMPEAHEKESSNQGASHGWEGMVKLDTAWSPPS